MKKPPFALRLLLGLISFVLCICLFVTAIAGIMLANVRSIVSKDTLQKLISDLMFKPVASHQVPAALPQLGSFHHIRLENAPDEFLAESAKPGLVVEWVYGFLQEQMGEEFDLTYEHINNFFEESTAKDFLSEKIAAVISDACTGEQTVSITSEEISGLIAENKELIEKHFGITLTEETLQNLDAWVEETGLVEQLSAEGIANMLGEISEGGMEPLHTGVDSLMYVMKAVTGDEKLHIPTVMEAARFMISDTVLFAVIGVAAALLALLVLVNLVQIHKGLIDGGITLIFAGGIMLAPAALSSVLSGALPGTAGKLMLHLLNATIPAALITLGIAVALLAGGIVLRVLLPKRKAHA